MASEILIKFFIKSTIMAGILEQIIFNLGSMIFFLNPWLWFFIIHDYGSWSPRINYGFWGSFKFLSNLLEIQDYGSFGP